VIAFGRDCHRHRDALLDFVDRRERGPGTEAALAHLETCAACTWDIEATAMAVMALRRIHAPDPVEPAPDAWQRLRTRIERPRAAVWRWRASLAGLAVGAGLVGTMLAPASLWAPRVGYISEGGSGAALVDSARFAKDLAEARIFEQQRASRSVMIPAQDGGQGVVAAVPVGWAGPDGLGTPVRVDLATGPPVGRSK
jgi:anti-sigma factor RsiW